MTNILFNQFAQSSAKGKLELTPNANIFSCMISQGHEGDDLKPGQAVKLVTMANKVPVVDDAKAGDSVFGFVVLDHKRNFNGASRQISIASDYGVMMMEAYGSVARGDLVKVVLNGIKVESSLIASEAVGIALDNAVDGALCRILIKCLSSRIQGGIEETGAVIQYIPVSVGTATTGDAVKAVSSEDGLAVEKADATDTAIGVLTSNGSIATIGSSVVVKATGDVTAGDAVAWDGTGFGTTTETAFGIAENDSVDGLVKILIL